MTYMMVVGVKNVSMVPTTAPFQFYIQKMAPVADFVIDANLTEALSALSTYYVSNSDFTILEQAVRWRFTSKTNVVLAPMSTIWVGFEGYKNSNSVKTLLLQS